jgi:putative transposase
MKAMADENRRLKKMHAEMAMQNELLKDALGKALRPSQRKEMARDAVHLRGVSVALVCRTFQISESCYRYQRNLCDENATIADCLVRLTTARRT